jgi:hypothetical protein
MTDDLFSQDDNNTLKTDPNKNYLEELVGEGKKFKSPEELARGKYESDEYIKVLTRRFDELREDNQRIRDEANAKAKLEEILDRLESKREDDNADTKNANEKEPFDPKQIEDLVNTKLTQHETQKKQQENLSLVRGKLKEVYGDNYQDSLQNQIEDLGLTKDFFNDLAKNHPSVLIRTLGLDQPKVKESFTTPPKGDNTFRPQGAKKRTYSYYQELKKSNPNLYFDPKIAVQMHNDSMEQGIAFFDN